MKKSIRLSRLLAATTLSLSVVSAFAAPQKDLAPAEAAYQAGSSPLGSVDMYQDINPKAPTMSKAEFDEARKILSLIHI